MLPVEISYEYSMHYECMLRCHQNHLFIHLFIHSLNQQTEMRNQFPGTITEWVGEKGGGPSTPPVYHTPLLVHFFISM